MSPNKKSGVKSKIINRNAAKDKKIQQFLNNATLKALKEIKKIEQNIDDSKK